MACTPIKAVVAQEVLWRAGYALAVSWLSKYSLKYGYFRFKDF
jgi:hypothetical protein